MREEEEKMSIERKKPYLEMFKKSSMEMQRKLSGNQLTAEDIQETKQFQKIQRLEYDDEPDDYTDYQPRAGKVSSESSNDDE